MRGRAAKLAHEMALEFVLCHAWGHVWEADAFPTVRPPQWGYRESCLCGRCSSERHFIIDSMGRVSSRYYKYADGYSTGVRTNRSEWRRELRQRAFLDPSLQLGTTEAVAAPRKRKRKAA